MIVNCPHCHTPSKCEDTNPNTIILCCHCGQNFKITPNGRRLNLGRASTQNQIKSPYHGSIAQPYNYRRQNLVYSKTKKSSSSPIVFSFFGILIIGILIGVFVNNPKKNPSDNISEMDQNTKSQKSSSETKNVIENAISKLEAEQPEGDDEEVASTLPLQKISNDQKTVLNNKKSPSTNIANIIAKNLKEPAAQNQLNPIIEPAAQNQINPIIEPEEKNKKLDTVSLEDRKDKINEILKNEPNEINEQLPNNERNNTNIEDWRKFKSNDGRTLVGKLLTVRDEKVEILQKNGRGKVWANIAAFSKADQTFINSFTDNSYHATGGTRIRCKNNRRSREKMEHYSRIYNITDKTMASKGSLDIEITNLRRSKEKVLVRWFFLAKSVAKEGGIYAYDGGEKELTLDSLEDENFISDESVIKKQETIYHALRQKYNSGGTFYGWICTTEIRGEITCIESSNNRIDTLYSDQNRWNNVFKP